MFNPLITNNFMAITSIETIYVVEMTNVETDVVTTLPSAYASLDNAYAFIEMCKRMDERSGISQSWTYRVKSFSLFR